MLRLLTYYLGTFDNIEEGGRDHFNLRPGGGRGSFWPHQLFFFANSGKNDQFRTITEISPQGHHRSGHQVKSSDPTSKSIYDCAVATVCKTSIWNFQELISISSFKNYVSEFRFRCPEVRLFKRAELYEEMKKMFKCRFLKSRMRTCHLSKDILILDHSQWPVCSFDPITPPSGHSWSNDVKFVFASNFQATRRRPRWLAIRRQPPSSAARWTTLADIPGAVAFKTI